MSCLRFLLLAAAALPTIAAHADTITTDHVVFTVTTAPLLGITVLPGEPPVVLAPAVTQQYSFSFVDGSVFGFLGSPLSSLSVTVTPGANTTGSPSPGFFNLNTDSGITDFSIDSTGLGIFDLRGSSPSPLKSVGSSNNLFETLFFQPGTYALTSPLLSTTGILGPAASASYTITQTTTGTPAPVSVTPEPSSLALLGTGLLGVAGVVRRRLAGAA